MFGSSARYFAHLLAFGWTYLRPYRGRFFCGIALGVLFGLTNGAFVWSAKIIAERFQPPAALAAKVPGLTSSLDAWAQATLDPLLPRSGEPFDLTKALLIVGGIGGLAALRGGIGYLSSYCMGWSSERMIQRLRCALVEKMNGLSLDYFFRVSRGDILTQINNDAQAIQGAFSLGISDLIKEPVTLLSILAVMLTLNPELAFFGFLFMPLCVVPVIVLGKKIRRASEKHRSTGVTQSTLLLETVSNIRVVKAFSLEKEQAAEYARFSQNLVGFGMKGIQAKEMLNPIIETIAGLTTGAILVYVFYRGYSFPELFSFIAALGFSYTPVKKLAQLSVTFQKASVSADRLMLVFAEQPSVREKAGAITLPRFNTLLEFRDTTFDYGGNPVLRGVSFSLKPGEKVGLVGESGSGKSTLVNLLFRFYDVTGGSVLLDGIDVRDATFASLRANLALVSQEILLFNRSIAENIAFGQPGATRTEIEAAARAAFAHDFIAALPAGYDTVLGEGGSGLSGGQRQRISIARALVRNAPILALDEATAALDSQAEAEVQKAIDALPGDRAVLIVAHRLATLRQTDRIIVLHEGRILEQGSFPELMAARGPFFHMASRQGLSS